MPEMPDVAAFTLAPDWVCEVLSGSTAAMDRGEKMPVYARQHVHVWLVDPIVRTLEVFRLDGETYRLVATWHDEARLRAEPFEAVELDLAVLWARWRGLSVSRSEESLGYGRLHQAPVDSPRATVVGQ